VRGVIVCSSTRSSRCKVRLGRDEELLELGRALAGRERAQDDELGRAGDGVLLEPVVDAVGGERGVDHEVLLLEDASLALPEAVDVDQAAVHGARDAHLGLLAVAVRVDDEAAALFRPGMGPLDHVPDGARSVELVSRRVGVVGLEGVGGLRGIATGREQKGREGEALEAHGRRGEREVARF